MYFDNPDERIFYQELLLERELDRLPVRPLPAGYRFVFYRPGDRDSWITIEQSAREFDCYDKGIAAWQRYYGGHEEELPRRMLFIEEESTGEKVATATAYYDVIHGDPSGSAWLHWVAVRRDRQGRGLSKPLVARALAVMKELGYTHAKVPTQTTSWVAVKVYLDLGFRPISQNAERARRGWGIVRALTGHPALAEFPPAGPDEILARQQEAAAGPAAEGIDKNKGGT